MKKIMFRKFAHFTSEIVGAPLTFFCAVLIVVVWGFSGQFFEYSNTWQLVINTGTTIITFLMIFLVQNTQNRDARAIHLKLDELIRSLEEARNDFLDIEDEPDQRISDLQQEFKELSHHGSQNDTKK
jgi:low affinity Fe/Cu permease